MENSVQIWEKENDLLVGEIKKFCINYEQLHKGEFIRDEFKAHEKMLDKSVRIYKTRIKNQVKNLLEIRKSSLTA